MCCERDLLQSLAHNNSAAFEILFNRYKNKIFSIAHKFTHCTIASEEIVQEVFLNIWKKKETITIENLSAYLASMTRYEVYRYVAKQKKHIPSGLGLAEEQGALVNDQDHIDQKILLEIIEKLSHRLPEKCRLVFVHNKLLDKPLTEVAAEMAISSKTAEAHLTKALKVIRENIKKSFLSFYNFLAFF